MLWRSQLCWQPSLFSVCVFRLEAHGCRIANFLFLTRRKEVLDRTTGEVTIIPVSRRPNRAPANRGNKRRYLTLLSIRHRCTGGQQGQQAQVPHPPIYSPPLYRWPTETTSAGKYLTLLSIRHRCTGGQQGQQAQVGTSPSSLFTTAVQVANRDNKRRYTGTVPHTPLYSIAL